MSGAIHGGGVELPGMPPHVPPGSPLVSSSSVSTGGHDVKAHFDRGFPIGPPATPLPDPASPPPFPHGASSLSSLVSATISGAVRHAPLGHTGSPEPTGLPVGYESERKRKESIDWDRQPVGSPPGSVGSSSSLHSSGPLTSPSHSSPHLASPTLTPSPPPTPPPRRDASPVIASLRKDLIASQKQEIATHVAATVEGKSSRNKLLLLAALVTIVGLACLTGGMILPGVGLLAMGFMAFATVQSTDNDIIADMNKKKVTEEYEQKIINRGFHEEMAEILENFETIDRRTGFDIPVLNSPAERKKIMADKNLFAMFKEKPTDPARLKSWREGIESYLTETHGLQKTLPSSPPVVTSRPSPPPPPLPVGPSSPAPLMPPPPPPSGTSGPTGSPGPLPSFVPLEPPPAPSPAPLSDVTYVPLSSSPSPASSSSPAGPDDDFEKEVAKEKAEEEEKARKLAERAAADAKEEGIDLSGARPPPTEPPSV